MKKWKILKVRWETKDKSRLILKLNDYDTKSDHMTFILSLRDYSIILIL